jgi:hypothetical protein
MLNNVLTVLCIIGFSTLNAANETLPSIDNSVEGNASVSKLVLKEAEKNKALQLLPLHVLKQRSHQLRMRLMNQTRSRSIAPPEGAYRRQLELNLAEINRVLKP